MKNCGLRHDEDSLLMQELGIICTEESSKDIQIGSNHIDQFHFKRRLGSEPKRFHAERDVSRLILEDH